MIGYKLGSYRGYIGIMEYKMETTIIGLGCTVAGFRVWGCRFVARV